MSISTSTSAFPLKSILKKENDLIRDVQNSETRTEAKTNKSLKKKIRNSFKRLSFKKTLDKKGVSLDLKPSINIEKKSQKKVTFKLDELKEGNYLKMKPVPPPVLTRKALEEMLLHRNREKESRIKQERYFKGNHSHYQYMRSPEEEYQKIWECT